MSYEEFIKDINSGKIGKVKFSVQDYNHYRSCTIERCDRKIVIMGREVILKNIKVRLTNDNSELYNFYKTFNEDMKLFKIGKQKFTLKQMWNRITITEIE